MHPSPMTAQAMLSIRKLAVARRLAVASPIGVDACRRSRSSSSAAGQTMASPVPMHAPAITSLAQCTPRYVRLIAIRAAKRAATIVQRVRRPAAGTSTTTSPMAVTDAAIACPDGNDAESVRSARRAGGAGR